MRSLGVAAALVLTLAAGGFAADVALADDHTPSKSDVQDARAAADAAALDVDAVRERLAVANQRLQQSAIAAAQASEAYNGARWRAAQARQAAAAAQQRSASAASDVQRQRDAYGDAMVTSYEMAPALTALSAIVQSDGIETVLQHTVTMTNAEDALDGNYDAFRAAATVADIARDQADGRGRGRGAGRARTRSPPSRTRRHAADAAAAQARSIADEKASLIARLADLQHISVELAQRRQSHLEQRARAAAAAAAAEQAQAAPVETQAPEPAQDPEPTQDPTAQQPTRSRPRRPSRPTPRARRPRARHAATPTPSAPPAPAPAAGAGAAIAFARAQLGEPYRWGASGPNAWDCSGLTMGAWRAGGTYLPHYSVAQYEQSTPISASDLQPGDLVFWGSSSSPGSIYHVALYVGNGTIIQAPRTGRPGRARARCTAGRPRTSTRGPDA